MLYLLLVNTCPGTWNVSSILKKTKLGKIEVVAPWVDTEFIKPIKKTENWFAIKHNQTDKLTVLCSGNLGATHAIEHIVKMARVFQAEKDLHFMVIGDGFKRVWLENIMSNESLCNITLLSSQPENVLPYSLATGDMAIIAMEPGIEGFMVPSSYPYHLAAGSYIMYFGTKESEIGVVCQDSSLGSAFQYCLSNMGKKVITFIDDVRKNQGITLNSRSKLIHERYSKYTSAKRFIDIMMRIQTAIY